MNGRVLSGLLTRLGAKSENVKFDLNGVELIYDGHKLVQKTETTPEGAVVSAGSPVLTLFLKKKPVPKPEAE